MIRVKSGMVIVCTKLPLMMSLISTESGVKRHDVGERTHDVLGFRVPPEVELIGTLLRQLLEVTDICPNKAKTLDLLRGTEYTVATRQNKALFWNGNSSFSVFVFHQIFAKRQDRFLLVILILI